MAGRRVPFGLTVAAPLALLVVTACATVAPGGTTPISSVVVFGDSYSDGGRGAAMSSYGLSRAAMANGTDGAFPLPAGDDSAYVDGGGGRWSNGPTAVEVLADELGAELSNFAVGGARSDEGNYYAWLDEAGPSGLLGQIEAYGRTLSGEAADPDALHVVFASANDYFEAEDANLFEGLPPIGDADEIDALADAAVANVAAAVNRLAALGARRFLVVNSTDLALVPWESFHGRTDDAARFTRRINDILPMALSGSLEERDLDITVFDHVALSDDIRADPAGHGIAELDEPCRYTWYPDQEVASARPTCAAPDEHYFWDEWHPTAAVHRIVGRAMLARLSER